MVGTNRGKKNSGGGGIIKEWHQFLGGSTYSTWVQGKLGKNREKNLNVGTETLHLGFLKRRIEGRDNTPSQERPSLILLASFCR